MTPMVRWAGIALLPVLVSACAAKPAPLPATAPVSQAPDLTNRELMEALAREGVGRHRHGGASTAAAGRGEALDTEIRETPRGVVVTFRHILFAFDSAQLGPVARREVERFAFVLNDPRVRRRRVTLEGHADAIGEEAYNLAAIAPAGDDGGRRADRARRPPRPRRRGSLRRATAGRAEYQCRRNGQSGRPRPEPPGRSRHPRLAIDTDMAPLPDPTDIFPFGLRRPPFQPTADPDFFFRGGQSGDALDRIVAALRAQRGVCVLTGETGTGKTTVLRKVLVELAASGGLLALCGNAPLGLDDLISLLGASPSTPAASGEEQLQEVTRRLRELADEGQPVVLAIDEAQALDEEMLGHLTALVGTAFGSPALGSLLLVGQHALAARLEARGEAGPEIAVSCSLGPLPLPEVGAYIAHRLRAAGGRAAEVFSPAAVERIARLSGGTPRFVNLLCHESLGVGVAPGRRASRSGRRRSRGGGARLSRVHAPPAAARHG